MELTDIGYIKELCAKYGFTFSKSMGQNFLVNPSVCPRMAEASGADKNTGVIEIGTGVGVLTKELALRAKKVVCVELDERLFGILDETLADFDNVTLINGDILKVDIAQIIRENFGGMRVAVCANLPYYITTPVIMRLLESETGISSMTLMLQKEAAIRICARPGTRETGAISAAVNYWGDARKLFDVPRTSFIPSPNVDSAVIKIDLHKTPDPDIPREAFFRVVKAAFSMRRKTLVNCLSGGLSLPKADASLLLQKAGIPESLRAEALTMEQFSALSRAFAKFS